MKKLVVNNLVVLIGFCFFIILAIGSADTKTETSSSQSTQKESNKEIASKESEIEESNKVEVTVVDFSSMDQVAIQSWADKNKVICKFFEDYSDSVAKGSLISQSSNVGDIIYEGNTIKIVFSLGKKPSTEYMNALKQAESYSESMHMSKNGIYDQLTSDYGGKFPAEAAQYAIDNVKADWNSNALKQAESYSENMHMSKNGLYDQLTSEHGGKFTKEQAQYAIDNIQADWNNNALEQAKSYQSTMNMSKSAVYDQLVSEYGGKFTKEQAQYAIDNLDD